ncbi:MAG: hypothetical protein A3C90_03555 [Candidatus Magasanikbacteria bacterium RIFCSPHIGHO2_02_FULL_51_14]|uniref:DUF6242 domain-containing protein n=1 Tax=Candidatus Magasanikbacteria bacterium RIFCSPHIGHO2_02_FULL_51_14 TaxID=1798683 RepID=A0A1F6MDQ8_9BACT|nr:MAG: hypothetical protein A3C90_03555 [Candidatus Magasanikbacteria bacterium RIFCSPHIGHO2_02_FULL_51_14]
MKRASIYLFTIAAALLLMGQGCLQIPTGEEEIVTTGPAGMFVSTDKGENWQAISALPEADGVKSLAGVSVYRLDDDPQDPKAIYWGSRGSGLLFSYDDGRTWRRAAVPLNTGFIYSVAVHPKDKCTLFATTGLFVYKTDDCARSWQEVHREDRADARVDSIFIDSFGDHTVFLTKANGELLSSSDGGSSWTVVQRFGTAIGLLEADAVRQNTLYLATRKKGLYRSDDGGKTWVNLFEQLRVYPGATEYRRLFVHPTKEGVLYWISTYGILKSTDRGDSWRPYTLITSPGSADIFGFDINRNNDKEMYYTAMVGGRSTFYKTEDDGKTWSTKRLPSGQIPAVLRVHPVNANIIYVGFAIPPQQ